MAVLLYTTTISVAKTTHEIIDILTEHGATDLHIQNDANRQPCAVTFEIETAVGPRAFRLPANTGGVLTRLEAEYRRGRVARRFVTREQAARTGWRVIRAWIDAQIALIEAGMSTMDEALFPHMLTTGGTTVYEEFRDKQLALPPIRVVEG